MFPQIEQQIHAFEHLDDFHCSSSDKHFHEQEHTCAICDYTVPDKNEPTEANFCIVQYAADFNYSSTYFFHFSEKNNYNLSARAPPIV